MYKDIHIGEFILKRWKEVNISISRASNFLNATEEEINSMFLQKSLDSNMLLRWSKLLEYDFFRLYSQHLILYAPPAKLKLNNKHGAISEMPKFKKNIYTIEIIEFLLELIRNDEKTIVEIINEYKIPKTTLYKWIKKYNIHDNQ
ncbi:transposase [Chryseobacterium defluvii]|uniref:Uncharacterized protein n=1 Tax=Chryseobacterium defluvii TaxID=160396 RepID=A0A495SQS8_9FLAO|nr:transposase [Chryseobacterium defluvii]RKT01744.1 hypothetical protein BCF58_0968 [Chryseobacterium defluvii]